MFDHVMLNVANKIEAMTFYTPVLQVLSIKVLYDQNEYAAYGIDNLHFWLRESKSEEVTRKMHLAFSARCREQIEKFYQAALAAGGTSNGAPGLREHGPKYYAAYVLDLASNNIEVVCNN
jgi:uncharacterized glyoxalase superfamily protein PhnB